MSSIVRNLRTNLKKDLPAGLVVFLVALPLCLGIALASGAPALSGIITGIIGGIIVACLSGSALSVSGPAAGLTVIVLNGITDLGSFESFLVAVVIAGALQLVLGYAKAGIIGLYFPSSVIKGMLAAIGLTLILKQIPHFIGFDQEAFSEMNAAAGAQENYLTGLLNAFTHIQEGALIIGVVSLAIILFWDNVLAPKFSSLKLIPSALIAVFVAIGLNLLFRNAFPGLLLQKEHLVNLPAINSTNALMSNLRLPDFSQLMNPQVYVVAITIAIVASLETLLSIEAVDKLDPQKRITPPNRELKAQGVGNLLSGLLGGLPMTAVIVRSSANLNAGAQTRISAVFHGVLLLLSLLLLSNILNLIPLSALAAVLLVVGYKLTKPVLYKMQIKLGAQQFIPFIVTILAILFTDLLKGIGIGLVVGVFYILKANYKSPYFFKKENYLGKEVIRLKLSEHVSFLNKASIVLTLDHLPAYSHVIIDGERSEVIDYDVLEAIQEFKTKAFQKNITLELVNIPEVQVASAH
ncbi:SulP family inorganic anion transporter [Adhaeribacter soli]|uniref:SulP family inorganic anion transporter n=1 Tax=Adhaeribacter soli TaxID=2607655 RepID=A0A5N1J5D2_9BACT|nr:SulP family inorganic anion transporter [Adhaeribacter soli]KAA9345900.1 SulP family inorganic anion transporter [Adhaeribacter soli]